MEYDYFPTWNQPWLTWKFGCIDDELSIEDFMGIQGNFFQENIVSIDIPLCIDLDLN